MGQSVIGFVLFGLVTVICGALWGVSKGRTLKQFERKQAPDELRYFGLVQSEQGIGNTRTIIGIQSITRLYQR